LTGQAHVVFEPLDFLAKLAALVPRPRVNLTRRCAGHSGWSAYWASTFRPEQAAAIRCVSSPVSKIRWWSRRSLRSWRAKRAWSTRRGCRRGGRRRRRV